MFYLTHLLNAYVCSTEVMVKLYRRKGTGKQTSASCPPLLLDMKRGDGGREANEKLSFDFSLLEFHLFVHILKGMEREQWCQIKNTRIVSNSHSCACELLCLVACFQALEQKSW